ncbi:hypothetical protein F2P81_006608 [Scophthalmus maximus]|uniref:Uncharacterized protein n=1 Tax=Scophthalmus maximus TaxID=52904 RepID=A0A6A4T9X5_SCOMX|nr:hypothetical protein F2P81_006608 [Scophthalmus maximus]
MTTRQQPVQALMSTVRLNALSHSLFCTWSDNVPERLGGENPAKLRSIMQITLLLVISEKLRRVRSDLVPVGSTTQRLLIGARRGLQATRSRTTDFVLKQRRVVVQALVVSGDCAVLVCALR